MKDILICFRQLQTMDSYNRNKYSKIVGATGRHQANLDDFLYPNDRTLTSTKQHYDHGSVSSRSRQNNTATRLFSSSKHDMASTRNRFDDNRSDTEKVSPIQKTTVTRDHQASPRPLETSFNGRTSPETSEMDKIVSLLKELKNIDLDNIKQSSSVSKVCKE